MNNYKFGNYICELREKAGYTQTELAALLDISDKTISKWENGQAIPRMETLEKLADALGTTVEDFISAGKDNIIRVYFYNDYAEVAYLKVDDRYISVAFNEGKWVELSKDTFDVHISGKFDFVDKINDELGEEEQKIYEKLFMKMMKKAENSFKKDILFVDCVYKFNAVKTGSHITLQSDDVNLGDKTLMYQDFVMLYPKIICENCGFTLISANGKNTDELIRHLKRSGISTDVGIDFITMILAYPIRGIYFKHLCKPNIIKKNILNADSIHLKNEKKEKKKGGCAIILLVLFLLLVYTIFIEPILFVKSDKPGLISTDYLTVTLYDEVYTRTDELPEDAVPETFLGAEVWYDARIDGLSSFDQVIQEHKLLTYTAENGDSYIWLVLNYNDTIYDENGDYYELEDFDDPMIYKCAAES